jgi:dihydroxy-acid dehydratase
LNAAAHGGIVALDVEARSLMLEVSDAELAAPTMQRGRQGLYVERALQADKGGDLDFLVARRGAAAPRERH